MYEVYKVEGILAEEIEGVRQYEWRSFSYGDSALVGVEVEKLIDEVECDDLEGAKIILQNLRVVELEHGSGTLILFFSS